MGRLVVLAAAAFLAASPVIAQCTDCDGDGFSAALDCNDLDPSIHPGAPELCNGRDSDCDGQSNGPPSGRFCCGNGILEDAEGDGTICDGNL